MKVTYEAKIVYDRDLVQRYVERMYRKAIILMIGYGLLGGFLGNLAGAYYRLLALEQGIELGGLWNTIGIVVVGLLGALYGHGKGFYWKLEAQRLLVLTVIEENTRKSA